MKCVVLVFAVLLGVSGCDKGADPQPEVHETPLSSDESAMLAHLPAGNVALFGGNLLRFQKYLSDSPLNRMMGVLTQASGKGMTQWMNCYVEAKDQKMVGAVKIGAGRFDMASVVTGIELSKLETCAKRAGFPTTMDADGKFLGIEFPNLQGPMKSGYLVLPGGMLYTRVSMEFPKVAVISVDRAALEQDVASIANGRSAETDMALMAQVTGVDRSKALWFVANAAGTPVADKVGTAHGTFDIDNGMAFDINVQIVDKTLADNLTDGVAKMKEQAASMGGTMKSVLDKLVLERHGDQLRFKIALDNAQLNALVDQVARFAPPARGQQ